PLPRRLRSVLLVVARNQRLRLPLARQRKAELEPAHFTVRGLFLKWAEFFRAISTIATPRS
ncbi:MAG: hypothetical protein ABJC63_04630, partial [Gemmatimonadales bacterium]